MDSKDVIARSEATKQSVVAHGQIAALPAVARNDGMALPPSIMGPLERSWTETEAFAYCSTLTKSHYENFPVGSSLIPKDLRPAVHSLYAFMRTADDFSDENRRAGDEAERLEWLNQWEAMLADCQKGQATHPIFIALHATLRRHELPVLWLHDLLHAFKMDVTVRRYATFGELQTYCRYSANPVGRLILTLFGYRDEDLYRESDAICTGLQLANHWQDVAVDLQKDRIYLPQEDMRRFSVTDEMLIRLAKSSSPAATGRGSMGPPPATGGDDGRSCFRKLMAFQVSRSRELFEQGQTLPERVTGRLRWELRFTWQGGVRILDKIEQAGYDVFTRRPVVSKADWLAIAIRTLF